MNSSLLTFFTSHIFLENLAEQIVKAICTVRETKALGAT